ncbi:MAG TPA: hypothetical protein VGK01_23740, partial [Candidatus Angelobacter sp.]
VLKVLATLWCLYVGGQAAGTVAGARETHHHQTDGRGKCRQTQTKWGDVYESWCPAKPPVHSGLCDALPFNGCIGRGIHC